MHSGTQVLRLLQRVARSAVLALVLLPAWSVPTAVSREGASSPAAATIVTGPGSPTGGARKSVHEFASCFLLILGVGGVLLALSSGLFAPVLGLVLVRAAWEICS